MGNHQALLLPAISVFGSSSFLIRRAFFQPSSAMLGNISLTCGAAVAKRCHRSGGLVAQICALVFLQDLLCFEPPLIARV
jgi:hypothetical protein